ncbi:hypothetical protein AIG27_04700 [Salmonella enterica subsp. enterica]|nr:hypothetical protein [Salmonella enterica]ECE1040010.1 hypothetical protein [Salmonella enterica subsp. enterica]EDT7115482.1 hypothetical protein [Salmonella enterica subsp. enterica]EDW2007154.1 hypothetical protein [Salmonella enterica subsp. enterica]EEC0393393.1 hypothetical protein [Salmonella enterica subsp. enterica]
MAKPVRFTREVLIPIAKRYFEAMNGDKLNVLKEEGIDQSDFRKLLKRYDIKVKLTAEVW